MARRPNDDTEPRVQQLVIGPYRETGMGSQDLANAGFSVAAMNPTENKTLRYVFFLGIPLALLTVPMLLWNSDWAFIIGFTLLVAYLFAAYEGIVPLARAAERLHETDEATQRPLQERATSSRKTFVVLGEEFDKGSFPVLYRWHERNPDTLAAQLQSIADAWHEGSIVGAAQALESDLETDSDRVPEETKE